MAAPAPRKLVVLVALGQPIGPVHDVTQAVAKIVAVLRSAPGRW